MILKLKTYLGIDDLEKTYEGVLSNAPDINQESFFSKQKNLKIDVYLTQSYIKLYIVREDKLLYELMDFSEKISLNLFREYVKKEKIVLQEKEVAEAIELLVKKIESYKVYINYQLIYEIIDIMIILKQQKDNCIISLFSLIEFNLDEFFNLIEDGVDVPTLGEYIVSKTLTIA